MALVTWRKKISWLLQLTRWKCWVLLINTMIIFSDSTPMVFYCDPYQHINVIAGNQTGHIHTLFEGQTFYDNNQKCQWLVDAGADDKRVHLTVLVSNLQWAPESAICTGGYDFVDVKDGSDSSAPSVALWCGSRNPRSIISTGQYLLIMFQSNEQNPYTYTGASMEFTLFGSADCPPGYSGPMNDSAYCYQVKTFTENWLSAQIFCNYDQANLASITSEEELKYLQTLKTPTGHAWIGLNKIESESSFRWIDNTSFSFTELSEAGGHDLDCVAVNLVTGAWVSEHCLRHRAEFVCKTNRGRPTRIYPVPEEKKENDPQSKTALILAAVLGSLVILCATLAVIIIYIRCCRMKPRQQQQQQAASCRPCEDEATCENITQPANRTSFASEMTRGHGSSRQEPSAPFLEFSEEPAISVSYRQAPPPYEEALTHPVIK